MATYPIPFEEREMIPSAVALRARPWSFLGVGFFTYRI
jgi:hypothetical protein